MTAHSRFLRKKQSSHVAFPLPLRPFAMPIPFRVSKLNYVVEHQSELHTTFAIPFPGKRIKLRFSENGCKQREFSEVAAEGAAFSGAFSG